MDDPQTPTTWRHLLTLIALLLLLTGTAITLARLAPALDVPDTIWIITTAAIALAVSARRNDRQDR